mmetsp:Transcript_21967/g.54368  ORF Transcript_21967/g.54368 Transcript_21967/m.54368 type:complete len:305 (+) Transcript_21967:1067-1981(+)
MLCSVFYFRPPRCFDFNSSTAVGPMLSAARLVLLLRNFSVDLIWILLTGMLLRCCFDKISLISFTDDRGLTRSRVTVCPKKFQFWLAASFGIRICSSTTGFSPSVAINSSAVRSFFSSAKGGAAMGGGSIAACTGSVIAGVASAAIPSLLLEDWAAWVTRGGAIVTLCFCCCCNSGGGSSGTVLWRFEGGCSVSAEGGPRNPLCCPVRAGPTMGAVDTEGDGLEPLVFPVLEVVAAVAFCDIRAMLATTASPPTRFESFCLSWNFFRSSAHFGSRSWMRMCSGMSDTATLFPVKGSTARAVDGS